MSREIFVGFSTVGVVEPPYRLNDIELVKQDLMNALQTRKGERVMQPTFGTRIYDMLMDPFDDETQRAIIEDVMDVINEEPRVTLVGIDAQELEYVMRVSIELRFTPYDIVELLYVDYNRQNLQVP